MLLSKAHTKVTGKSYAPRPVPEGRIKITAVQRDETKQQNARMEDKAFKML